MTDFSVTFDPELASEVSSRLHASVPGLHRLFASDNLTALDGSDLERLMMAGFLLGYGEALADVQADYAGERPTIMAWAERQPAV